MRDINSTPHAARKAAQKDKNNDLGEQLTDREEPHMDRKPQWLQLDKIILLMLRRIKMKRAFLRRRRGVKEGMTWK